ncbi:asparagine synthase (glutamine-hydrolyzing) [bacterium]|nr:asparagine synthase (glutamine-hydrolyzing) [bacterium]
MCGICGYAGICQDEKKIEEMAGYLDHRGPDDEGYYQDKLISFAHKRLSIIDLAGGHQPMFSRDKRYVIIYNGEIYNYRELRQRLEKKGHVFVTQSDTEVLLVWVIENGVEGLTELNGMFAFALWDSREKTLLLARDRLGIKPLYYYTKDGVLIFASEIKAILPAVSQREANMRAVYEFLTFQNILGEQTFFKNIWKLLPGTWLSWNPHGIKTGIYWDVSFTRDNARSFEECLEEYGETLRQSVKRHMIADVPVGAYLSGGFDSSAVATLASRYLDRPLHTFTGAFNDSSYYDERVGSRAVAKSISAVPHEVEIKAEDYLANIGKVIYHLDEPTLGTGAFPQYMVSKLVSQSVKVVLTGHGGDELFAGYQVNKVALIKETFKKNPLKLLRVLSGIRKDEWTRVLYFLFFPLLYSEIGHGLFIMTPRRKRTSFFSPDFLARNKDFEPFDVLASYVDGKGYLPGEELLVLYLKTYLPTLFIQEDKVGMAHSIEARTPLCDNEMVELALRIPLHIKLRNNTLKALTKQSMKTELPEVLFKLPKRGFPTPFTRWYRKEPLHTFMKDLLFDKKTIQRTIVRTDFVKNLFMKNQQSGMDTLYDYARANQLYSISIVELWFRTFIDSRIPQPVL